jgi:hypothetical protein
MFNAWFLKLALRLALKKAQTEPYSFTIENRKNIDYRTVMFTLAGSGAHKILVKNFSDEGLTGLLWNGDRFECEGCIEAKYLKDAKIEIIMSIGGWLYRFHSIRAYIFAEIFKTKHLLAFIDRIFQWRFDARIRERNDRAKLLSELVSLELERISRDHQSHFNSVEGISHIDLFTEIYKHRIWGNVNQPAYLAKFKFFLESYVETGEIKKIDGRYVVSPAALSTVARDAVADRRHSDLVKQNWAIIVLTLVLAISAVFEIFGPYSQTN